CKGTWPGTGRSGGSPGAVSGSSWSASLPSARGGHVGDDAPDPVVLVVDAQDPHRRSGAPGRPAALGIGTQAVDAAVQGHEHAVEIDHADGAHIAVAHHIL